MLLFFYYYFLCAFVVVVTLADNDDILVCLGFRFVSFCFLFCLFVCLVVCFSHMGLCEVYSSSLGINASHGSERLCHIDDADSG